MTSDEIVAKLATAIYHFEPITDQTSDTYLTRLREAFALLLLQIPYNETGGKHNLIGIIRSKTAYVKRYGEAFPEPKRVEAYDIDIKDDATVVVWERLEAIQKAGRADRATFETTRLETTQYVLAVVADTWVWELRDPETIYTEVDLQDLFAHLQAGCTGRHVLDLLALHNKMQRYHIEVEGVPAGAPCLQVCKKILGGDLRVNGVWVC